MTSRSIKLLAFALAALTAGTARADYADMYTAGHADLAVSYDAATGLSFFYELSSGAVVNGSQVGGAGASADPSSISVVVPESVRTTGDSRLPSPFAGSPLYVLMQTSAGAATRPFLGFGGEEIPTGAFVGDALTFTLTGFSSSTGGEFVLYSNGSWANPAMNTADGLSSADVIDIFAGGHDHYNLGFTAAGIYDLTLTAAGSLVGGGTASTSSTFRFLVGTQAAPAVPEPSSIVMAGLAVGASGLIAARRRKSGR